MQRSNHTSNGIYIFFQYSLFIKQSEYGRGMKNNTFYLRNDFCNDRIAMADIFAATEGKYITVSKVLYIGIQ